MPTNQLKNSHNYRNRQKGLENLTEEEYNEYIQYHEKDKLGRVAPHITKGLVRMFEALGTIIFKKKQICTRCNKKKPLKDFVVRYNWKGYDTYVCSFCKECESERSGQWQKDNREED